MEYFYKVWLTKYKNLFNYYELVHDIIKLKNYYINNNGNKKSETNLISKIKSLNKVYLTNNICETIHQKIAVQLPNCQVTKKVFRDTILHTFNEYIYKTNQFIRRDYITRTLVIITEKYNLNEEPKYIEFKTFKKELEYTISVMTGKIKINAISELINSIEELEINEFNISDSKHDLKFLEELEEKNSFASNLVEYEYSNTSDSLDKYELDIKDKDLYLENISIDFNDNNEDEQNNNSNSNEDYFDDNESINKNIDINNLVDEVNEEVMDLNIKETKKERGKFNLYTLDFEIKKNEIKDILLNNAGINDNIKSEEDKLVNKKVKKSNRNNL